jgi:hypothetical protein
MNLITVMPDSIRHPVNKAAASSGTLHFQLDSWHGLLLQPYCTSAI